MSDNHEFEALESMGARIAFIRKRLGMTQTELAVKAAMTQATIWQLENDGRTPNAETTQRLADALGVSAGKLLNGTGAPTWLDQAEKKDPDISAFFRGVTELPQDEIDFLKNVWETMKKKNKDGE